VERRLFSACEAESIAMPAPSTSAATPSTRPAMDRALQPDPPAPI
jgi:hypothetical protein